jgi:alcohol dehydrogenase class IV
MKFGMNFLPWRQPKLIEGEGSVCRLAAYIKSKGQKSLLIVTDKTLMGLGLLDGFIKCLENEGLAHHIFDEVVPNPTIMDVEAGLVMYKENNCDAIVAFGGGSVMDCAKVIGARVVKPKKSVKKMKGLFKVLKKLPPLYAVPTTAGTGSETTVAAVITDSETLEKFPMMDLSLVPDYAVLDPDLTVGLPPHITATTGMDTLTHAVEAFIGRGGTKSTDKNAREAAKLVFTYLKRAYDYRQDKEARLKMLEAAYKGGAAFTRAYVGYVHAIAHVMGGLYGTPHGLANAVILPHVLEKYGESVRDKLAQLADVVFCAYPDDTAEVKARRFIESVRVLNTSMQIPDKLKDLKREDFDRIATQALKEANPLYPVPEIWGKAEILEVLEELIAE